MQEPERPATPPPTLHNYTSPLLVDFLRPKTPEITLHIQLVGSNPLWGHVLWNAGVSLADYFLRREREEKGSVSGSTVLELGAGGGLPALVAGCVGASRVIMTDYPDAPLLDNLRWNIQENARLLQSSGCDLRLDERMAVEGHIWGRKPELLLDQITGKYDILILSDLIFNHSQHAALLDSSEALITPRTGKAYVFHSHHLPQFYLRDLDFFRRAAERGWRIRNVVKEHRGVMFERDQGDESLRGTVWGWEMTWDGQGGKGEWNPEEHSAGLSEVLAKNAVSTI